MFGPGAAVTDEPGVLGYCYALYDYVAVELNQLSLRRGDRVAVISKAGASRGWWKGRRHGKVVDTGAPASSTFLFTTQLRETPCYLLTYYRPLLDMQLQNKHVCLYLATPLP